MTLPDHLLASFLTQKLVQETSHGINFPIFVERLGPSKPNRIGELPPLLAALSSEITLWSSNNLLRTKPFKNQRLQQIGDQPVLQRSDNFTPTITCGLDYTFPDFSSVGTDVLASAWGERSAVRHLANEQVVTG